MSIVYLRLRAVAFLRSYKSVRCRLGVARISNAAGCRLALQGSDHEGAAPHRAVARQNAFAKKHRHRVTFGGAEKPTRQPGPAHESTI